MSRKTLDWFHLNRFEFLANHTDFSSSTMATNENFQTTHLHFFSIYMKYGISILIHLVFWLLFICGLEFSILFACIPDVRTGILGSLRYSGFYVRTGILHSLRRRTRCTDWNSSFPSLSWVSIADWNSTFPTLEYQVYGLEFLVPFVILGFGLRTGIQHSLRSSGSRTRINFCPSSWT